jgi:hypothetical protein
MTMKVPVDSPAHPSLLNTSFGAQGQRPNALRISRRHAGRQWALDCRFVAIDDIPVT